MLINHAIVAFRNFIEIKECSHGFFLTEYC